MRSGEVYLVFLKRRGVVFCALRQDSFFLRVCVISPPNIELQICTLQPTFAVFPP